VVFSREKAVQQKKRFDFAADDRPMRPLFPESWRNETQINAMVLSADSDNDPDVIAVTGSGGCGLLQRLAVSDADCGSACRPGERAVGCQPDRG